MTMCYYKTLHKCLKEHLLHYDSQFETKIRKVQKQREKTAPILQAIGGSLLLATKLG